MDRPEQEGAGSSDDDPTVTVGPSGADEVQQLPSVIADRFTVSSKLGEGGMGAVYKAHDSTLDREVALKCVRAGRLGVEAEERAVREARALAKVSHPNVVAIYDVLIEHGRLILAMEYVRGSDLKRWLEQEERPLESILDMFIQAGRGLAAVHEQGLLHRDFKPANVLVGGDGRARVVDFGLARLDDGSDELTNSDGDSSIRTTSSSGWPSGRVTRTGTVMGTPAFMAPEQHTGGLVDHRADIYAFCAALRRALVGEGPFTISDRDGYAKLVRDKRRGPPPWPKEIDAPRHVIAAIQRGLAARVDERWGTMQELVDALSRTSSRAKWARNGAAAGVLVLGSLGAGVIIQERRALCGGGDETIAAAYDGAKAELLEERFTQNTPRYIAELWPRVGEQLAQLRSAWVDRHREVCEATRVRKEQSVSVMDLRMSCLFAAKARLATAVELLAHGDHRTLGEAPRVLAELPPLSRCDDVAWLEEQTPPLEDPAESTRVEEARRELGRIDTLVSAGLNKQAATEIEALVHRTSDIVHRPYHAELARLRGSILSRSSQYDEAVLELRRATELALELRMLHTAAQAANDLAFTLGHEQGRLDTAKVWTTMAYSLVHGRPEARRLETTLLGTRATLHMDSGNYAEAEADYEAAVALASLDESTSTQAALLQDNLGAALAAQGRLERAQELRTEAWQVLQRALGEHHPETLRAGINVATMLLKREQAEASAALYEELLPALESALGPDNLEVASVRFNLGIAWGSLERFEEALEIIEGAIQVFEAQAPENALAHVKLHTNLGEVLSRAGQRDRALETAKRAVTIASGSLDVQHPDRARAQGLYGTLLVEVERLEEAIEALDEASASEELDPRQRARFAFASAKALWQRGEPEGARARAEKALRLARELQTTETQDARLQSGVREVQSWLETHAKKP